MPKKSKQPDEVSLPTSFWKKYLKAYDNPDPDETSFVSNTEKVLKTLPIWKEDTLIKGWLVVRDGVSLNQINDYIIDLIETLRADAKK